MHNVILESDALGTSYLGLTDPDRELVLTRKDEDLMYAFMMATDQFLFPLRDRFYKQLEPYLQDKVTKLESMTNRYKLQPPQPFQLELELPAVKSEVDIDIDSLVAW